MLDRVTTRPAGNTHEAGRLSPEAFTAQEQRHFYMAADDGWYGVFEQTDPRPNYWQRCVGHILFAIDASELAEQLNSLRLPKL